MKKLFLFLTVSILSLTFLSCSKDEEPSNNPSTTTPDTTAPAEAVAGSYNGSLSVTINELDPIVSNNTISVEKVSNDTINLTLKNFSIKDPSTEANINLGDIKLSNVALNGEAEPYTFTAKETLNLDIIGNGTLLPVPVEAKSGKFENNKLSTTLYINFMDAMDINVTFEGTK